MYAALSVVLRCTLGACRALGEKTRVLELRLVKAYTTEACRPFFGAPTFFCISTLLEAYKSGRMPIPVCEPASHPAHRDRRVPAGELGRPYSFPIV